jgi:hypothetical protein
VSILTIGCDMHVFGPAEHLLKEICCCRQLMCGLKFGVVVSIVKANTMLESRMA